jgi:tetratricopeptide (TPR) repeat protein
MKRTGIREVSTRRRARAEAFTLARIGGRWDALDLAGNAEGVMRIREQFGQGRPVISFEFFPPKNEGGWAQLYQAIGELHSLKPSYVDAWLDRGCVYQKKGRYDAALADYQKALDLGPTEARLYNQYAWMLAACPRPEYRDGARGMTAANRPSGSR